MDIRPGCIILHTTQIKLLERMRRIELEAAFWRLAVVFRRGLGGLVAVLDVAVAVEIPGGIMGRPEGIVLAEDLAVEGGMFRPGIVSGDVPPAGITLLDVGIAGDLIAADRGAHLRLKYKDRSLCSLKV